MNFKKLFLEHCNTKGFEINESQVNTVKMIDKFYQESFNNYFLTNFFSTKKYKNGFYLQGDVGVGKTMILNFFYDNFDKSKQRFHFNEFMINFHDFVFQNKKNKKINIID